MPNTAPPRTQPGRPSLMTDLFENPMGTDGFEFIEYAAPEPEKLAALFVHLSKTKNGDERDVPLSKRAVEILKVLPLGFGPAFALDDGVRDTLWRRSEEHTSELQSLMRISYAVFCLK